MIIFILKIPKNKNLNTNEICLYTVGKEENAYILEYVEHYKSLGLDKIYLYDNNNIDGEKFEDVIDNYIKSGFVEIVNFRGKKKLL
jgi:ABC-type branched-subunit amino acid transport system substrate-binding protein